VQGTLLATITSKKNKLYRIKTASDTGKESDIAQEMPEVLRPTFG
jgi:hypothetical protein